MKANQKGFGIVEILIVTVAIGLIAAVGWLVYDRQINKSDTTAKDTNTQINQQEESTDTGSNITANIYKGWKSYETSNGISFKYPANWVLEDEYKEGSILLRSEALIDDETVNDRPLSKNIYLQVSVGPSDTPEAGSRFMAGANEGKLLDPKPTKFKEVKLNNSQNAFVYKQLTSSDETNAAEVYFLADMNITKIKIGSIYLNVTAEFNAMQSDYEVITSLKQSRSFVADERQEIQDFINLVKSITY